MRRRKLTPKDRRELAQVEAQEHRAEQGEELTAKHQAERLQLEQAHRDRLLACETEHRAELARLEARQLGEVAALWKRQGRKLGPWAAGGHFRGNGVGHA